MGKDTALERAIFSENQGVLASRPSSPFAKLSVRLASRAMHTRFELLLCGEESDLADLRAAGEEALAEIEQVESWLSAYREDAVFFQINAAKQKPVRVDARLLTFLQTAQELSRLSNGSFDLTIGPLVELWRSHGQKQTIPSPEEIAACLHLVGTENIVRIDPGNQTIELAAAGARLDAGAIGKGYALDRAANVLRDVGIRSALLHGGTSSLIAIGAPPNHSKGWPIAVQHPLIPEAVLTSLTLKDQALGVSAVHGRTFYAEGRRFGHILNSHTGYPVEKTLLSACVHPLATYADALSTALLVQGSAGLSSLADRFPEAGFLVVEQNGENHDIQQFSHGVSPERPNS
jgi:thiamine biosynthesis lipoprotein